MRQLYKRNSLVVTAAIGLSLATVSASLTLAALTPVTAKSKKISDSLLLLAQKTQGVNKNELLAAHNKYRQAVSVPPLKWSDSVASSAQQWANQLAATRKFQHSNSSKYGENLWAGTSGAFSQTQMVDSWGNEKQYFISNSTFPNTCQGGWQKCGHYTQIIWKQTTELGCGLASSAGNDYLVCQYNPPGNFVGQKPF